MAGIGGLAAAALAPVPLHAGGAAVGKPPRLREGDIVGLVQPAGFVDDQFELEVAEDTIRAMGLVPRRAAHLTDRYGYLAGSDRARAADLQAMYADKEIAAVFAVRGGWGSARMLPHLDWRVIRANPKLLVGYSDITALHMAFAAHAGFATIHGPTANSSWTGRAWDSFRALAFEGETPVYSNPVARDDRLVQVRYRTNTFRPGTARGPLLGGNLTVLSSLVGTPYLPDFAGAILFLEDIGEAPYRVDRMLTQLGLAGILEQVAGVVFGACTDCTPGGVSYGGFTLSQVLQQHFEPLGIPAFEGAQIGHIAGQVSMPVGVNAEIDAAAGTVRILEPAVS